MTVIGLRRASRVLALCMVLAACGEDAGTTVVLPARLRTGTWYMHAANGDTLPAKVGSRNVGIALEETFIDSARIEVITGGTFEQRVFLRVTINGATDREELFFDKGTWATASVGYTFVSDVRARSISVTLPFASLLATSEPLLTWSGAPTVSGEYRQTAP